MAYIYEQDVTKVGGNLQKTVAYLLSLHKNEYEWNLLGIKVVGHVDALPIPEGTYEYGDAYTVGTAAPYDMWIYTRADEFHSEAYWFNIGKFPAPGPQGPKGDGLEQVNSWTNGTVSGVTYNQHGAIINQTTTVDYTDSTDGSKKQNQFDTTTTLPIIHGKYIYIYSSNLLKQLVLSVNDTALSSDYYKIDKSQTTSTIPYWDGTKAGTLKAASDNVENSVAQRDANGDCNFRKLNFEFIGFKDGNNSSAMYYYDIYNNTRGSDYFINKTPTNTGTLTNTQLAVLQNENQSKNLRIVYDNKVYYRMHQQSPANSTLNYIHIDYIEDASGGHKATCKCFSVKVSTREWKVFDLNFTDTGAINHNIVLTDNSLHTKTAYFQITNNHGLYAENSGSELLQSLGSAIIPCTILKNETDPNYMAGILKKENDGFHIIGSDGVRIIAPQNAVISDVVS